MFFPQLNGYAVSEKQLSTCVMRVPCTRSPFLVFIDVNQISGIEGILFHTDICFAQHLLDGESDDLYYITIFSCMHIFLYIV